MLYRCIHSVSQHTSAISQHTSAVSQYRLSPTPVWFVIVCRVSYLPLSGCKLCRSGLISLEDVQLYLGEDFKEEEMARNMRAISSRQDGQVILHQTFPI